MTSKESIANAIVNLDEKNAQLLTDDMIKNGLNPLQILEECRKGMSMI